MSISEKLEFPRLCRHYRMHNNLKLKDVAESIGLRSYANAEYNNHKTVRIDKVHALARLYQLGPTETQQLVAAWEALPVSEYSQKQRDKWDKRNAQRSKAKAHDTLWRAAVEAFGIVAGIMFDEQWSPEKCASLCACDKSPGVHPPSANHPSLRCEFCTCLEVLGMPEGWTDLETVTAKLAEHQDKMDGVTGTEE